MAMKNMSMIEGDWEDIVDGESSERGRHDVKAVNMLRALANPHRLKILKLLDQAPHTVMDLCERLSLRQSLASQHLARLRLDGIVAAERQGHHVIYSLQDAQARKILAILDDPAGRAAKAGARKRRRNGRAASSPAMS
jgi:DNA-binding transcriptional ArsR family regulator